MGAINPDLGTLVETLQGNRPFDGPTEASGAPVQSVYDLLEVVARSRTRMGVHLLSAAGPGPSQWATDVWVPDDGLTILGVGVPTSSAGTNTSRVSVSLGVTYPGLGVVLPLAPLYVGDATYAISGAAGITQRVAAVRSTTSPTRIDGLGANIFPFRIGTQPLVDYPNAGAQLQFQLAVLPSGGGASDTWTAPVFFLEPGEDGGPVAR